MCLHHVSQLLIIFFGCSFKDLLEDGYDMGIEIWLACQGIDNLRDVDFTCCIELTQMIITVRRLLCKQEFNIWAVNELGKNLHIFVYFLDSLVDINGFCVKHFIIYIAFESGVSSKNNDFVSKVDIGIEKCWLFEWTTINKEDFFKSRNWVPDLRVDLVSTMLVWFT